MRNDPSRPLHRGRPARPSARRPRPRDRRHQHGGDVAPALRPRRRRPPLPEGRAGRAEGRVPYANYPASFFEPFYYKKNFDLPGYRWRLLDGDTELAPGLTVLRTDGHTPGHQSLLVQLPQTGPDASSPATPATGWSTPSATASPASCGIPTLALHSIKRITTLARLIGARIFPGPRSGVLEDRAAARRTPTAERKPLGCRGGPWPASTTQGSAARRLAKSPAHRTFRSGTPPALCLARRIRQRRRISCQPSCTDSVSRA